MYCSVTDIQNRFRNIVFGTKTEITASDVTDFITISSDYIDAQLSGNYETPITGAKSLNILKMICTFFVCADINDILTEGQKDKETYYTNYRKMAQDMLDKIIKGVFDLSDAAKISSGNFYNNNVENNVEPVIKKDEVQW